jgi:hypothetical protein
LDVEGIGETYALKLKGAGIGSLEALLKKVHSQGRKELAETSGISEKLILEWVNLRPVPHQGVWQRIFRPAGRSRV